MGRKQAVTLGEFIIGVVRKEICDLWLLEDPSSFDVEVLTAVLDAAGPPLARDLVELAKGWLPEGFGGSLDDITMETALSESGRYFPPPSGEAAVVRRRLQDSLQDFFSALDLQEALSKTDSGMGQRTSHRIPFLQEFAQEPLVLPPQALFSIVAQIAPVLEGLARLSAPEAPLTAEAPSSEEAGGPSSRWAEQCRRRIFALERELVTRSRNEEERITQEKSERQRAEARLMEANTRLMEVNTNLEEGRRKAGQKLIEAQRGMDNAKGALEEKSKKISQLEYTLSQHEAKQDEIRKKEEELSKRLLRVALAEDLTMRRERDQIARLQKLQDLQGSNPVIAELLRGDNEPAGEPPTGAGAWSDAHGEAFLDRLKEDFDSIFRERQDKCTRSLEDYEKKLSQARAQYHTLSQDVLQATLRRDQIQALNVEEAPSEDATRRMVSNTTSKQEWRNMAEPPDTETITNGGGGGLRGDREALEEKTENRVLDDEERSGSPGEVEQGEGVVDDALVGPLDSETDLPPEIDEMVAQEAVAAFNMSMQNTEMVDAFDGVPIYGDR